VCAAILRRLVKRGLRLEPGLLCVIDGAKGLRTAISRSCGRHCRPRPGRLNAWKELALPKDCIEAASEFHLKGGIDVRPSR
jgi:hypothetical protein